jgi:two-component system, NtrC family, sensor kinase
MHCHGDPQDAPLALIELYGRERGFGHRPGEIAGISAVTIPVDVALAAIKDRAVSVFGISLFGLSLLFVGISFFFNRVVVHNLRDLLDIFRYGLRDEKELELLSQAKAKDEIGELTAAAQVLVGHLGETRQQLEDYTEKLEGMVASRTEALERSKEVLQEKVIERNRELKTLTTIAELVTQAGNLVEIFPRVLVQTLGLIPARGAALYLLKDNPPQLELQCQENASGLIQRLPVDASLCQPIRDEEAPDLTSSLIEASCGRMSFFSCLDRGLSCVNTPLICRGRVLGVMTFVAVDFIELTPERRELLQSIGQQIGITIESLQNLTKLLESKDLLQTVFDGITDMLVLLDRNMCIKMVNKAYLNYFGLSLEQVLEQPCRLPHPEARCPFSHCSAEDLFVGKKPLTDEVQGTDGRTFLVHYYPILDDKGEVISLVRYAKDITMEKQVEERIQQTEKLAALGQLAAGVAHELNNPLGVILCYTDLLKREMEEVSQASAGLKDVATIEKHAKNCQRIVADLLNFARGQETAKQLTAVNPTIIGVMQMVEHQFRQHCTIELDLDPTLPDLRLDVDKMKQVYVNLLMNARQAMKDFSIIRITTRYLKEAGQVQITFWDNGQGISPEIKGKIFDPFFSTKKTGEGTGLGLSVSYGIIRDHGGDIQVESEPGQWTQFTISLPVIE